ncbi:NYN domain-containing protein [Nocardioides aurantiacus]|uniref:OST-HTH/LOTUS domain-containing protein n=1 Tax=Nocardioides aurantiacus TaxID=86796 RepID=A0A3N2CTE5_9ACTN|nr:NYN domain-containing protein [Nocardioides aurantiacus]ROR90668.1 OST-HTH/LOTUS domain-containing protein [Nocardioides aurantiacus]
MTDSRRLAVLIDADNVSSKVSTDLFAELAGYGLLTVKRAYGDWTTDQLNGWKKRLHEHAISPMQQFAYTTGKNSSDSALIIDAMDLLYAGNLDGFVIVSSDSDFTRLATRLRESAMTVYGVGAGKTPRAFRDACDKFTFLEVLGAAVAEDEEEEPAPQRSRRSSRGGGGGGGAGGESPEPRETSDAGTRDQAAVLQSVLSRSLNKADSDDEDWTTLGSLGTLLTRTDPSFDARTHGFGKLSDLIREQPFLETRTITTAAGTEQLMVRLKGRRRNNRGPGRRSRGEGAPEQVQEQPTPEPPGDSAPEPVVEPAVAPGVVDVPEVPEAAPAQAEVPEVESVTPVAPETVDGDEPGDELVEAEPVKKTAKKAARKAPAKKAAAKTAAAKKAPAKKTAKKTSAKKSAPAEGTSAPETTEPAPQPAVEAEPAAAPAPGGHTVTVGRTSRRSAKRAAGPSKATDEAPAPS